nr:MAG TPA: hypothetical protein [Bacteriophage sp.]
MLNYSKKAPYLRGFFIDKYNNIMYNCIRR